MVLDLEYHPFTSIITCFREAAVETLNNNHQRAAMEARLAATGRPTPVSVVPVPDADKTTDKVPAIALILTRILNNFLYFSRVSSLIQPLSLKST